MKPADDPAAHRKALFDGSTAARADIRAVRDRQGDELAESFANGVIAGAIETVVAHAGEEAARKTLESVYERVTPGRGLSHPQ